MILAVNVATVGGSIEFEIATSDGHARNSKTIIKAHNSSTSDVSVISGATIGTAQVSTLIATTGVKTLNDQE